jgi:hypothetical protein
MDYPYIYIYIERERERVDNLGPWLGAKLTHSIESE